MVPDRRMDLKVIEGRGPASHDPSQRPEWVIDAAHERATSPAVGPPAACDDTSTNRGTRANAATFAILSAPAALASMNTAGLAACTSPAAW